MNRTGEVRCVDPDFPKRARAKGRRKDAPAKWLTFLDAVIRLRAANDHAHGTQQVMTAAPRGTT